MSLLQVSEGAPWLLLPWAILWRCRWVLDEGEGLWARDSQEFQRELEVHRL